MRTGGKEILVTYNSRNFSNTITCNDLEIRKQNTEVATWFLLVAYRKILYSDIEDRTVKQKEFRA